MRWSHAVSSGIRRLGYSSGFVGGGGVVPPPEDEVKTIPPGHGSHEFNITEINGVLISKFSFVQIAARGLLTIGAGTGVSLGLRLSTDGGSTYLSASGSYRSIAYDEGENSLTSESTYYLLYTGSAEWNANMILSSLNASKPTMFQSHELNLTENHPFRRTGMTPTSAVVHDAIQFYIDANIIGDVKWNGGTLDMVGYR